MRDRQVPVVPHPPPRLRREAFRYWVSVAITVVTIGVGTAVMSVIGIDIRVDVTTVTIVYFAAWTVFSLSHSVLTWRTLSRADGATLARWLEESPHEQHRRRLSQTLLGTGGTSAAISLAGAALAAVVIVAVVPVLRENVAVLLLAVVVVVASWVLLVTVLSVRYAAEDPASRTLRFPGSDDRFPIFSDHVYLAVQVVTTFSPSDVVIEDPALRREITGHTVIAFAFNTVIVALLVSLLVTAAG